MAHLSHDTGVYRRLQRRLERTQSGAADTPELYPILAELFTPQEATVAARMPVVPRRLSSICRRVHLKADELRPLLDRMADKGLVLDFPHPTRGTYYMLAPPVIGFFELSMMSARSDINQKALAHLLCLYLYDRPAFMQEVTSGHTPIGRAVVHETALGPQASADVLDYEKASSLIRDAKRGAVSLCYCRHKKAHLQKACSAPQSICMSLGNASNYVTRHHHGRPATVSELLELLEIAREHGLVQIADNVRNSPSYLCHCCGCCCGQLAAINRHGLTTAVATSNFLATIERSSCSGCGKCARACPIQAISLRPRPPHDRSSQRAKMVAEVDASVCLGCGVCQAACRTNSLVMAPRAHRVLTPADTFERVISMALGRGHLHDLLFDEEDGPSAAFLNRLVGALERMPPARRLLVNQKLKSRFVAFLAAAARYDPRQPSDIV